SLETCCSCSAATSIRLYKVWIRSDGHDGRHFRTSSRTASETPSNSKRLRKKRANSCRDLRLYTPKACCTPIVGNCVEASTATYVGLKRCAMHSPKLRDRMICLTREIALSFSQRISRLEKLRKMTSSEAEPVITS